MLPIFMVSFLFAYAYGDCERSLKSQIYTVVAAKMASSGCSSLESDEGSPERKPNTAPGIRNLEENRKNISLW